MTEQQKMIFDYIIRDGSARISIDDAPVTKAADELEKMGFVKCHTSESSRFIDVFAAA